MTNETGPATPIGGAERTLRCFWCGGTTAPMLVRTECAAEAPATLIRTALICCVCSEAQAPPARPPADDGRTRIR